MDVAIAITGDILSLALSYGHSVLVMRYRVRLKPSQHYINFESPDENSQMNEKDFIRILPEVERMQKMLDRRRDDPDDGWDEREALRCWVILCGPSPMDEYLFGFVQHEIPLQDEGKVAQWQSMLCELIGFMLCHGMPMERLVPCPEYQEQCRQARNAEEALLAVLNVCARVTRTVSKIHWPSSDAAGNWIHRLRGQRTNRKHGRALKYLSWLDLSGCNLRCQDLFGANLQRANLEEANLRGTNLRGANLEEANLQGADLEEANLRGGILQGADLEGANLEGANLQRVNLQRANLRGANLRGADLEGANLEEANLRGADLEGANLRGANLRGADLEGADLEGANLQRVNLQRANLEEANLQRANLEEANLVGANLQRANLVGANLQRANLVGANLQRANLQGANLVGADLLGAKLRYADLKGANLNGANLRYAKLQGADLQRVNLQRANLEGENLQGADLRGANLQGANLVGVNLEGADLQGVDLQGLDLRGANLNGADLSEVNLRGANLRGAILNGANLEGANLEGADLRGAKLREAKLREANLLEAKLEGADLRGAILNGAYLLEAKLQRANLRYADLQRADLEGANLEGANLRYADLLEANLRGAKLEGAYLRYADLQRAKLQRAKLEGADLEGADLEGANLPEANLKGTNLNKETNSFRVLLDDGKQPNGVLEEEARHAVIVANALSRYGPTQGKMKLLEVTCQRKEGFTRAFIVSLDREVTYLFRVTHPSSKGFEIWGILHAPHRFPSTMLASEPELSGYESMRDLLHQRFGSKSEETNHYPREDDGHSLEAAPISLRVAVRVALSLELRYFSDREPPFESWRDLALPLDGFGHIRCSLYTVPGCQLYDVDLSVGNGNGSHYLMEVVPELEAGLHAVHIVGFGWDGDLWELKEAIQYYNV